MTLSIELRLAPQQLDIVRRALRRHAEALSWVPERHHGDPDPTALQRESRGTRELLGMVGWIDALDESGEPASITFDGYVWRMIATALDTAATRYTEAAREHPGGSQAASYLRLEHGCNLAADTIRAAIGDTDESDE